jgi:uncharacterized protein YbjT (DUF2867 family)
MRVVVIGGTKFVGPASVGRLVAAGHDVAVAHSGAHEHLAVESVEHLHGDRVAPLREDARRRVGPYPGGSPAHDNVAMEDALERGGCTAVLLRPGAIYGPHPSTREWTLVRRVALGDRHLPLPDGGVQLFHRVAVDRVAGAIVAAADGVLTALGPATSSIPSTGTTPDWRDGSARSSAGGGSRKRSPSRRPTTHGRPVMPSSVPIAVYVTTSVSKPISLTPTAR